MHISPIIITLTFIVMHRPFPPVLLATCGLSQVYFRKRRRLTSLTILIQLVIKSAKLGPYGGLWQK